MAVYDVDAFNPAGLLSGGLNLFKGATGMFNKRTLIGRCVVPLRAVCDQPGTPVDAWYHLGNAEWSSNLDMAERTGEGGSLGLGLRLGRAATWTWRSAWVRTNLRVRVR